MDARIKMDADAADASVTKQKQAGFIPAFSFIKNIYKKPVPRKGTDRGEITHSRHYYP